MLIVSMDPQLASAITIAASHHRAPYKVGPATTIRRASSAHQLRVKQLAICIKCVEQRIHPALVSAVRHS